MIPRLILLTCFLLASLLCRAEEPRIRPLSVKLLSECDVIRPGQTFHLGILQTIAPDYHSYWRNPGTVGMPMQLEWRLPEGFQSGEILWPLPETSTMAAYTVWGYHESALLVVPIHVPSNARPGDRVTLETTAAWMCCAKSCHPDKETLSISVPVGQQSVTNAEARAVIAATLAEQPRRSDRWQLAAEATGKRFRLDVQAGPDASLPASAYFYDYDRQISSDLGQEVIRQGRRLVIRLRAEEHSGETRPRLRGVLVADTEWESGLKALSVDIPISRKH